MSSPSIEGDGLLNAAFHWLSDWSPFIILPSKPFVDEVIKLKLGQTSELKPLDVLSRSRPATHKSTIHAFNEISLHTGERKKSKPVLVRCVQRGGSKAFRRDGAGVGAGK